MKFRIYREYGALNSVEIFNAFEHGLKKLGHTVSTDQDAIPVIWSVLWHGRMTKNQNVYSQSIRQGTPIIIIEVGNLVRGKTWRISINHVNNFGLFANGENLDFDRNKKLGVFLRPINENRKPTILIAGQHERSLQWAGQPSIANWTLDMVKTVRQYTDRPIIVRPHPRSPFSFSYLNVKVVTPQQIPNTYDSFNIDYNVHCVINHNSGPGVQGAIAGTPVIVDRSSLAYPVSDKIESIDNPSLPDRSEWFTKLCHTEWTKEEIALGIPLERLLSKI